ncbi:MAG: helix-turn-helix domain-containing protein [Candidatus Bathyarchaeota archaeon]|nr:helix-turn-helix domain-containing protein [Candidatus Bathyarchaeota archaeon]
MDFESFNDVLKHPIRRKIILALSEEKGLAYGELMNTAEVSNTEKFNYHLKILGDLIKKDKNGKYNLTEKGQLAADFLQKFPEKKNTQMPLGMADAALIGLAGAALTLLNPVFLFSAFLSQQNFGIPVAGFSIISVCFSAYALLAPGIVMWLLTVKRTHSHDMYDLFKPALVTLALLLSLLVTMMLTKVNPVVTLSTPTVHLSQYASSHQSMYMSLSAEVANGIVCAFVGIAIVEFATRIRKKWRLRR